MSARTVAPFLTVRHKRCHVLTVMQYAVLRIITLLVRLSCRHCVSLGILAVDYLSESCILAFVPTCRSVAVMSFAAEGDGEVSPRVLLALDMIVADLQYEWFLGRDLRLTLHDETLRYSCD